jgi:hypothetical protein
MIDKLNISIQNKDTNKISYRLNLEGGYWRKEEYNSRGNIIYVETSSGFWYKSEYDSIGNKIYVENSNGFIRDDRKIKHINTEQRY